MYRTVTTEPIFMNPPDLGELGGRLSLCLGPAPEGQPHASPGQHPGYSIVQHLRPEKARQNQQALHHYYWGFKPVFTSLCIPSAFL